MPYLTSRRFEKQDTPFPLGRHVQHDSRSRSFTFAVPVTPVVQQTIIWGHITPVLNQGQKASCHDPETEILTRSGWLPFPDLTLEHEVATVEPVSRELTYERPTRVIAQRHQGDMYYLQTKANNFAVTGDHVMLVRKWNEAKRTLDDDFRFTPMAEVGWYAGLMTSIHKSGGSPTYTIPGIPGYKRASQRSDLVVGMGDWLRFLGIYLAEGTMIRPTPKCPNKVQIAAFKDREKNFVRDLLPRLGLNVLELRDRFTFENARVYRHLESLGLKGMYAVEKFVPRFVFEQSSEMIDCFLDGHRQGDGTRKSTGEWIHSTSSSQLAEDIQELALLAGYRTGVVERQPKTSVMLDGRVVRGRYVNYVINTFTGSSSVERKLVRKEHYDGMVYCAEVPTHHTLVTRRRGKILISGNCTGNAAAQLLNTDPFDSVRSAVKTLPEGSPTNWLTEGDALNLYGAGTHFSGLGPDEYYPPNDLGGTGLGVVKAMQQFGYIDRYTHCFTFTQFQAAIQSQPVLVGTSWTNSMFQPDPTTGRISVGVLNDQTVVGGHEWVGLGIDYQSQDIIGLNSWGSGWGGGGTLGPGLFRVSFPDFLNLLTAQGDIVVPHGIGLPG